MERRLAAVLIADVVRYSHLSQIDEEGTRARFQSDLREVFEPKFVEHHGRLVKTMGDGILVEFHSVVDALLCAVEIQQQKAQRNALVPPACRLDFRIGVNLGDVIVENDDIHGDGVNVAARLQEVAKPCGVAISGNVRENIGNKLALTLEDMGEQPLKNIDRAIHVYSVVIGGGTTASVSGASNQTSRVEMKGPSIAALPFENLSSDPEQGFLADGVVEEIIAALSRFRTFAIVARNSTFAYKGRAVDVREVARELGVRYVLEGSVRRSGDRVRIAAQLIEGASGAHLWADKFEGAVADIFDFQDEITKSVVGVIEPQIRKAEIERARRKRPESLDAWDLFVQALPLVYSANVRGYADAIGLLDRAIALEPGYAPALALASWAHEKRKTFGGTPPAGVDDVELSMELARRAMEADPDDAFAMALLGWLRILFRADRAGLSLCMRAVELNPNYRAVLDLTAVAHLFAGDLDKVITYSTRAIELSPGSSENYACLNHIASAHFCARRFAEAAQWAQRSIDLDKRYVFSHLFLAVSNAHLGRTEQARSSMCSALELRPDFTIASATKDLQWFPERMKLWMEGLRLAGMPEV
jgi:adenylate cyclase